MVCEKWVNDSVNSIGLWLAENGVWFEFMIGSVIALVLGFLHSFLNNMIPPSLCLWWQQMEIVSYIHHFFFTLFIYVGSALSTPSLTLPPLSPSLPVTHKGKNPAWVMMMKMLLFNRPDANQGNLRSAAYEALMELIKNSAKVSRIVKKKKNSRRKGIILWR